MHKLEFRTSRPVSIEAREDAPPRLSGYAAVFYREGVPETEYRPFEGRIERIAPGAFAAAIDRGDDVRAVFNHDSPLLGRTRSGTLELREDETGLFYSAELPDTQGARDIAALVKRGDISGSSFMFTVDDEHRDDSGDDEIREIRSVTLYDVGPVIFPAYEGTSVTARSVGYLRYEQRVARLEQMQRALTRKR